MVGTRFRASPLLPILLGILIAGCGGGSSTPTPGIAFTATPESITAGDSAVLSWTVSGADSISIDHAIGAVAPIATRSVSPSETTTYTLTATNAGGTSVKSVTVTVAAATVAPSNLTYATNPATYTAGTPIPPNAPSSAGGAVASYAVTPPLPAGLALHATTGVVSGNPTAAASTAGYVVTATNAAGSTSTSLVVTVNAAPAGPPAAPSGLQAAATSSSTVHLTWIDRADNETGFILERGGAETGPWTQIATPAVDAGSHDDKGLAASTTYWYRIRATNAAGDSENSTAASASTPATDIVPRAPSGLLAVGTSSSTIHLTWMDNSDNEAEFRLERAPAEIGPWVLVASMPANARLYEDAGLAPATTYFYRVLAANAAGPSEFTSPPASATTFAAPDGLPSPPSALTATATSPSTIHLVWTDTSNNEDGFKVERAPAETGPWAQVATPPANATAYDDVGLAASTTFWYRVWAQNAAGLSSNSTPLASATTPPPPPPPIPPEGFVATPIAYNAIQLTWTASPGAATYNLQRRSSQAAPWVQIATPLGDVVTFGDSGLTELTTYWYQIQATNGAGTSAFVAAAPATTPARPVLIPSPPPSGLTATPTSSSTVHLAWADNSANETAFVVDRGVAETGPWTAVATTAANVTSYDDSGLAGSTTYWYQVRATNSAGASTSGTASATTPGYLLTVTNPSTGTGTISDGAGINCGSTCTATFAAGGTVELTGTPSTGNMMSAWSGCDTLTPDPIVGRVCTVTMSSARTVTGYFTPIAGSNVLTVAKSGTGRGTISSPTISGVSCGPLCPGVKISIPATTVTLTATTSGLGSFGGWTGCTSTIGATCTVNVNASRTVTATFLR
jgi:titin